MKNLLSIKILLSILSLSALGQECKKLDDGQYSFKFKIPKKDIFMLTIKGDSYFITKDGKVYPEGKIEWWDDKCMFKLVSDEAEVEEKPDVSTVLPKTDSISVLLLNSAIAWQNTFLSRSYCYELVRRRKFRLTYCDNIHITSGEGRIKKK